MRMTALVFQVLLYLLVKLVERCHKGAVFTSFAVSYDGNCAFWIVFSSDLSVNIIFETAPTFRTTEWDKGVNRVKNFFVYRFLFVLWLAYLLALETGDIFWVTEVAKLAWFAKNLYTVNAFHRVNCKFVANSAFEVFSNATFVHRIRYFKSIH